MRNMRKTKLTNLLFQDNKSNVSKKIIEADESFSIRFRQPVNFKDDAFFSNMVVEKDGVRDTYVTVFKGDIIAFGENCFLKRDIQHKFLDFCSTRRKPEIYVCRSGLCATVSKIWGQHTIGKTILAIFVTFMFIRFLQSFFT